MDELVRRLRSHAAHHRRHARLSTAADCEHAADAITTLTAALEGLVKACAAEDTMADDARDITNSTAYAAARAALQEVGRG